MAERDRRRCRDRCAFSRVTERGIRLPILTKLESNGRWESSSSVVRCSRDVRMKMEKTRLESPNVGNLPLLYSALPDNALPNLQCFQKAFRQFQAYLVEARSLLASTGLVEVVFVPNDATSPRLIGR
jgi:hypothetical protein